MGIEDQQRSTGTVIEYNIVNVTGANPSYVLGEGSGISVVGYNSIVRYNDITAAKDDYIEVGGKKNHTILGNTINGSGNRIGISVNYYETEANLLFPGYRTIISKNKIKQ